MAVPERTVEQRRAASQRAVLARRRRTEVAAQVKTGALSLADLLELARTDEAVAAMRVSAAVASLPRMGPRRADEAMLRLRVSPSRRLRGLGSAQRAALIALAARSPKPEARSPKPEVVAPLGHLLHTDTAEQRRAPCGESGVAPARR